MAEVRLDPGRISTGEAYYLRPGHNVHVDADAEIVEFTHADGTPNVITTLEPPRAA